MKNRMEWVFDDGGRKDAGFVGRAGDCVTRAIAIAANMPYREVYKALSRPGNSARNGVMKKIYDPYLKSLGWIWVPTMKIGSGCVVHLRKSELPEGRIIVKVSKHLCAVIDGKIHDDHDSSRGGNRCVYGYWYMKRGES